MHTILRVLWITINVLAVIGDLYIAYCLMMWL
jgi:hypothetical protein